MPEELRLVLRADDAASCVSANRAVAEVVQAGAVRNVSMMACGPAFEDVIANLLPLLVKHNVCVGVHFTLNAEWVGPKWGPVLLANQVPSLVNADGYFTPQPAVLHERGFSVDEAIAEAGAQLARLRNAGVPVVYLDEHMGVGWIRGLRTALADFAVRENLLDANALPLSRLPVPEMDPDRNSAENLVEALVDGLHEAAPGDYLFVSHPGLDAPDMQAFYLEGGTPGVVARERDRERRALVHPDFLAGLQARGVRCARYDELTQP